MLAEAVYCSIHSATSGVCFTFSDTLFPPNKNLCGWKYFEIMSSVSQIRFPLNNMLKYNITQYFFTLQFYFSLISLKHRFKVTQVKVMSHLFHVVVSFRRETFQIIQSMCMQDNLCSLWPLSLHLCWELIFYYYLFIF